jgi:hypothetical protein
MAGLPNRRVLAGGELRRRFAALRLQMQHLAVERKIIDPQIDRKRGGSNLQLDRIAFSQLCSTAIETQPDLPLPGKAHPAHRVEFGQRTAERRGYDVDGHVRLPVWK